MDADIRAELTEFVVTNYLFGDVSRTPQDDDSLVQSGIVDSTGILELIDFLETRFGIEVVETETVPENFDTLSGLRGFVAGKLAVRRASV